MVNRRVVRSLRTTRPSDRSSRGSASVALPHGFLDGRERNILSLRFGLENGVPMTLQEIGNRLGVTREWVRRIELNAICKLRGESLSKPHERSRRSMPHGFESDCENTRCSRREVLEVRSQDKAQALFGLLRTNSSVANSTINSPLRGSV